MVGGVSAIDHSKRCVAERELKGGVVGVLRPWQPTKPLSGTVAGEAAQVHDDDPVGGLGSAVRLQMKGGRHVELRPHEQHELLPERRGEHRIVVRDDGVRGTMESNDVDEEAVRDGLGGGGVRQGDEVAVFAEAIHDGEDDHLALNLGQCLDEVDVDVGPHGGRNRQRLQ